MIPDADVRIDLALVRALLTAQAPHLAHQTLRTAAAGWDNVMIRVGDDLAVRMPRRASAAPLLRNETAWIPSLAAQLPIPLPVPLFVGQPQFDYPYPWSIVRWREGLPGTALTPAQRDGYAVQLAEILAALHRPAPHDAPRNPVRGVPVASRVAAWRNHLGHLPEATRRPLAALVDRAEQAQEWRLPPFRVHGDPHPMNLLAEAAGDGASITALLDLGDLTAGDPASDLGAAWLHFTVRGRAAFRKAYEAAGGVVTPGLWERAGGWGANYLAALAEDPSELGDVARQAALTLSRW